MGRQPKQGLDFWLRDVRLFRDPKLRRPRQEYGYLAPFVYECLLDIIYGDKGYYIDYRDDERDNVLWQLLELTQGRHAPTVETLANVIDSLAACGLFSGDLYRRGFITSKRAQKGYFSATLSRTSQQIDFDIWLLTEAEMRELNPSGKSFVLQSFISRSENGVSRSEMPITQSESTQSREEQSREEQSIAEYSREQQSRERADALTADVERIVGTEIDGNFRLDLARLLERGMQDAVIMDAAVRTANKKPRKPAAYLRTLLQNYERDGVLKASDLSADGRGQAAPHSPGIPPAAIDAMEQDWIDRVRKHREEREVQDE